MTITLSNARFDDDAHVDINGQTCGVESKWSLLREGLCNVRGPKALVAELHTTPSPDSEDLLFCGHWPLVELATRYWRMVNVDDVTWPPGRVEILHDEAAAREAWIGHIKAVEAAEQPAAA